MARGPHFSATTLLILAFLGYLAAHAVTGKHGVGAMMALTVEERALETRLAALEARKATLQDEVTRLSDATLDLDLLEERARDLLNAAAPDEIVIPALHAAARPPR